MLAAQDLFTPRTRQRLEENRHFQELGLVNKFGDFFPGGVHYPPIHLFSYYRSLGWREGMLPVAERIGRGIVTLPLFPAMQAADVERVCATLSETCKRLFQ